MWRASLSAKARCVCYALRVQAPVCLCEEARPSAPSAQNWRARASRVPALSLSLSLGRAQPPSEVGGRNINSNSCFLTLAVNLPEHTFLESPIWGNKGRSFWVGWRGAKEERAAEDGLVSGVCIAFSCPGSLALAPKAA